MQAMAEKRAPDDVRAYVDAQIDRLVAGDTQFILDAFPDDAANPELLAQIDRMRANIPEGEEVSRDIVGVMGSTEQAYSDSQGAVRRGTYNLAHELAFEGADGEAGFLLVQTATTLDEAGRCCILRSINATRADASPMLRAQRRRGRAFRIIVVLLLITSLASATFLTIRVGGKKAREAQMGNH